MEMKMLHQIKIRKLTDNDKPSPSCKFPSTDENDFQLKLCALIEDICLLPAVSSASQNGLYIDIESTLDIKSLLTEIKQLFLNYNENLRYDGPPWGELE